MPYVFDLLSKLKDDNFIVFFFLHSLQARSCQDHQGKQVLNAAHLQVSIERSDLIAYNSILTCRAGHSKLPHNGGLTSSEAYLSA